MCFDVESVIIEPLEKSHSRGAFACGVERIDNFFRNNARKDHESYKVRVYVARMPDSNEVLGFYSLTLTTLQPADVSKGAVQKFARVNSVPAIYLAMIASHENLRGKGAGAVLIADAFEKALQISELAGTYAMVLDALSRDVAKIYTGYGFEPFAEGDLKMFITLQGMRNALA